MGIIYVITCSANGKQYVGLTKASIERRWTEHKSTANAGTRNTKLANAIRKYGPDAFSISVLEQVDDDRDLVPREIHWISVLNTFVDGYNLTSGGEISKEWSDESRMKVSIANTGRKRSEEWKLRAAEYARARRHTPESLAKMSASQKGRKKPAELVEKVAEARRTKIYIDGVFHNGINAAHKATGIREATIAARLKRGHPGYEYAREVADG